jgi:hypothetical protein
MTRFNPQLVDLHALKVMRDARRSDFVYAAWTAVTAILVAIFGFHPILVALFAFFSVGSTAIGAVRTARIRAIEIEQAKVPQVWPPDVHQCPVCRSYAVDEIEYTGNGWRDFFGYRAHGYCTEYVWPLWTPYQIGR